LRKYHYVRWRWENLIDVDSLAEELSEDYKIKEIEDHGWDLELTYMKEFRDRYIVYSDTLTVFLAVHRVIMTQKRAAPFTEKDLSLRARLLKLFPKERPTFLPIQFNTEPEFETVQNLLYPFFPLFN
jgi:hypothetical protein